MRALITAIMAMGLLSAAETASAQVKLGYVDSRRLMQEAPGAQGAAEAMEQEIQAVQQQVVALQDSLRLVVQEYQQRSQMLTPEARRAEEQRIQARQRELQARADQLELEASRKQDELMKPIMDGIQGAINSLRTEGGYTLILDAASGAFVAADSTLDLTTQVLARLRSPSSGSR